MRKEKIGDFIKKYFSEFALIFISVILAFALTEWSNNQGKKVSEDKIYLEILNGLKKDSIDVAGNIEAHKNGFKACDYFRRIITNKPAGLDSLQMHYFLLTRNVISVQNTSGYETLKSKGLETVENDSLRNKIITLYEYDYQIMKKFEEDFQENQFYENYFFEFNKAIAPNFKFDETGNIVGLNLPLKITNAEKNILLSYLWKIQISRAERMQANKSLNKKINTLYSEVEKTIK